MGTRNLTIVKIDNQYKVAQYGQWDGYPEGQGATVLEFLKSYNRRVFEQKVRNCSFLTEQESDQINTECEHLAHNNWCWQDKWPELSRDTGAKILQLISSSENGLKLQNELDFAADSLFCEWAYVIDFDINKLEVYEGFNKNPLGSNDRFFNLKSNPNSMETDSKYFPIKIVKSYDLDNLPTLEQMVKDCEPKEE